jgi:hypothetical protein
MKEEYDISSLVGEMDFVSNQLVKVGKELYLTNREIDVLKQFKIPYQNCNNLKEVLFEIEEVIQDMDIVDEELDLISSSIAERDYYQNTNK